MSFVPTTTSTLPAEAKVPVTFAARLKHRLGFGKTTDAVIEENEKEVRALQDAMDRFAAMAGVSTEMLLERLGTSVNGLSDANAAEKLTEFGPNEISSLKPPKWWIILYHCFVLAVSNVVIPPADFKPFTYLMLMLLFGTFTRFYQEIKSNNAAQKLKSLITNTVSVVRCTNALESGSTSLLRIIDQNTVVPGDIVKLAAGVMFPADCVIIAARDLTVSQSSLTGEAAPVEKTADHGNGKGVVLDFPNVGLLGTSVSSGIGLAVVVATGNQTYMSFMAAKLAKATPKSAFDKGVVSVSLAFMTLMAIMSPLVFLIQGFSGQGWLNAFQFALTVAVGLIPEMMPMILNANLAKGAISLIKRKTIVKQLAAIQNLGAMDVLCSDKTGTLTQDELVLSNVMGPDASETTLNPLEWGFLNSCFQTGMRNLMDVAILDAVESHRYTKCTKSLATISSEILLSQFRLVDEIPFDFHRRRLSVIVTRKLDNPENSDSDTISGDAYTLVCKGAVEEVLSNCTEFVKEDGSVVQISGTESAQFIQILDSFNEDGLRVLAVATRSFEQPRKSYTKDDESSMVFQGFLTFRDPPKEDAAEAILLLAKRKVTLKVLSGDNLKVSIKVCRDVGIPVENTVSGLELARMEDVEFSETIEKCTVMAKLSPNQKQQIVERLQKNGHVVGFLGDGINDALALKSADVGVSVDSGSEVAKDSADVILLEKSLLILERGVRKGRQTYGNTIKYIKMAASSNFGNSFSVLIASIWLPFQPMTPLMILTNNFLYDFSQSAIPWDRMDDSFLENPRPWESRDLLRFMILIGPLSSIFDMITFAIGMYYWRWNDSSNSFAVAQFQTVWFFESLLTQTVIVHLIRTEKIPFVQSVASWGLLLTGAVIIAIGTCLPYTEFGVNILGMEAFPRMSYAFVMTELVGYFIVVLLAKYFYIRKFGRWL
ncbi:hypothetical protein HK100_005230 [Physocladia obscura]|uniref:Magnesium-transporting ATPase, P-type 1 n=1 Tax=Physocladia obscura TaxID=109957 RepID=A0AAD5SU29_9FUNG|nr:hypothetical protein HK100_005230 [Physocladia obscura]